MCWVDYSHFHTCPHEDCKQEFEVDESSDDHSGSYDECPECKKPIAWIDGEAVIGVLETVGA